jgi:mRNA interferase MazF
VGCGGGRRLAGVASPRRGDVYWVALDPTLGSEIRKTRPAIIVSNDSCNTYGTRLVVMPITSNAETLYPGEALVRLKGKPVRALGDQVRSIDKARLRQRIGRLNRDELRQVETALQITLGLTPSVI